MRCGELGFASFSAIIAAVSVARGSGPAAGSVDVDIRKARNDNVEPLQPMGRPQP